MTTKKTNLSEYNNTDIPNVNGLSFSLVVSQWNLNITENLFQGAIKTLIDCGVNKGDINRIDVPGSFELVYGAKIAARSKPSAIICIGSIIKGETKHFDFVSQSVSNGIMDLNIKLDIPIVFGVLTDDNMQQATNRSGGKYGNKGVEAAITAIKMAHLNI